MLNISFQFKAATPEATQDKLIQSISHYPGITTVDRIDPESEIDLVRRMCIAEVNDPTSLAHLQDRLSHIPEIESLEVPSPRELIW